MSSALRMLDLEPEEMDDIFSSAVCPWSELGQATRSFGMSVSLPLKENRSCLLRTVFVSCTVFHAKMNLILVSIPWLLFSTREGVIALGRNLLAGAFV